MSKKGVVVLGDKMNHGGEVKSASANFSVNGKKVALVGDKVHCKKHGNNHIVEGASQRTCNGQPVVVDGCKCHCGCVVISSATNSTIG
ncbi:PAAR domain-containing protein [Enterobacter sp. PTB]|uniref:PAAR domain-containing protein n=1 Tax=Enterobacter sp. PTB TaxID=3143437 RepID=UPI003DA9479F